MDKDGKVTYSDQPPPASARQAEEKKLGTPNAIATGGPDYRTKVAIQAAPVILYGSSDCASECQAARDFLKRNGVPFSEKTIKTEEEAQAFRKATGSEDLLVPAIQAGSLTEKGYEEVAWRKLLVTAGYPMRSEPNPAPR